MIFQHDVRRRLRAFDLEYHPHRLPGDKAVDLLARTRVLVGARDRQAAGALDSRSGQVDPPGQAVVQRSIAGLKNGQPIQPHVQLPGRDGQVELAGSGGQLARLQFLVVEQDAVAGRLAGLGSRHQVIGQGQDGVSRFVGRPPALRLALADQVLHAAGDERIGGADAHQSLQRQGCAAQAGGHRLVVVFAIRAVGRPVDLAIGLHGLVGQPVQHRQGSLGFTQIMQGQGQGGLAEGIQAIGRIGGGQRGGTLAIAGSSQAVQGIGARALVHLRQVLR